MQWFILRVQGKRIPDVLEALGDKAWRPVELRWTKPARKRKPVLSEIPMIPGWVFVKEELYNRWPDMAGIYGTLKFGRLGVLWVSDEDLQGLRDAEAEANAPKTQPDLPETTNCHKPKVGSIVRVLGLLNGASGVLDSYEEDGYARVAIGLLMVRVHHCLLRERGV